MRRYVDSTARRRSFQRIDQMHEQTRHVVPVRRPELPLFQCAVCPRRFETLDALVEHREGCGA